MCHTPPRGPTPDESMLLAAVLAFLEGLWRATRSAHPAVWRVERWLRDHRWTIAQFREFLAWEKAVPHSVDDSLEGRFIIQGGGFFCCTRPGSSYGAGRRGPANGSARTRPRVWTQSAPNEREHCGDPLERPFAPCHPRKVGSGWCCWRSSKAKSLGSSLPAVKILSFEFRRGWKKLMIFTKLTPPAVPPTRRSECPNTPLQSRKFTSIVANTLTGLQCRRTL